MPAASRIVSPTKYSPLFGSIDQLADKACLHEVMPPQPFRIQLNSLVPSLDNLAPQTFHEGILPKQGGYGKPGSLSFHEMMGEEK